MASADELLQVADTLLQMSEHIQRKRKKEDLVLETSTDFTQVQQAMRARNLDLEKNTHTFTPHPLTLHPLTSHTDLQTKFVAVPEHEWKKMCLYSNKMIHLIYHQKNLLQICYPGKSDVDIAVLAMAECKCPKGAPVI